MTSSTAATSSTAGFIVRTASAATVEICGIMTIANLTGNTWVAGGAYGDGANARSIFGGGEKTLSSALDIVRITRSGANTFDNGQLNVGYL